MPRYVVAIDVHDVPDQLVRTAARMAKQASAELVLLSVFDPPLMPPPEIHPEHMGLHSLAGDLDPRGPGRAGRHQGQGGGPGM